MSNIVKLFIIIFLLLGRTSGKTDSLEAGPGSGVSQYVSTSHPSSTDSSIAVPETSSEKKTEKKDTAALKASVKKTTPDSSRWARKLKNEAFGPGERLEFSVKYGKLPAGTAIIEIADTTTYDNHLCYRIISTASSNDVVSVFYKVRDSVETYLDAPGIFPRMFKKHLREGNYKLDRMTNFDQRKHLAITGKDTVPTYAFVQDPLSSLYYLRTQELVPGKDILVDSHTDRKNYPLKVVVYRKERVEVPAGTFDCVVIEPVMRAQGIFNAKGRIWIWLTDDQYKMPVMMKSEVFFLGSVSAQLSNYQRGKIG